MLVFVALLVAFLSLLCVSKRTAAGACFNSSRAEFRFFSRATLIFAGVLGMAGTTAGGGLPVNPMDPADMRLVTLDDKSQVDAQKDFAGKRLVVTATGRLAKANSILARRHDLAELREHIRYELRLGNITAEMAASLSGLIDDVSSGAGITNEDAPVWQISRGEQEALADLEQSQAQLNQTLADTIKLVQILGSVRGPEFSGTLVAAKIQVVKLLAEKAEIDGSIAEIRQSLKRLKTG
jgi:hypothetical protein